MTISTYQAESLKRLQAEEDVKVILNLNPISNPINETTKRVLQGSLESLSLEELDSFVFFTNSNRKFVNGESGYERFMSVFEKYIDEKEKSRKNLLLTKSNGKLELLAKTIASLNLVMKKMIEDVDNRIYSSKVIYPLSPLFLEECQYDYLIGVIKQYCNKTDKVYTRDIEKMVLVEMFKDGILESEISSFVDMHIGSIDKKIQKFKKKKLFKKEMEQRVKELLNEQSTYRFFKNHIPPLLDREMLNIEKSLKVHYAKELNFNKFKGVVVVENGEKPFTPKAIETLNSIGFREIYKMDNISLKEALQSSVLKFNENSKQIGGATRVEALLAQSLKGIM